MGPRVTGKTYRPLLYVFSSHVPKAYVKDSSGNVGGGGGLFLDAWLTNINHTENKSRDTVSRDFLY